MTEKTSSRSSSRPRRALAVAIGSAIFGLLAVALVALAPRFFQAAPEGPAIGGPFSLIDNNGHTVSDADFRGKLMLIYFGYTFCPDVCPTTLGNMAQALDMLSPEQQAEVVPIFITVDPERDTVDQLAQYVDAFSPAFVGLTGTPDQIAPVLKEFRVYARKTEGKDGNYSMDHSSILYLMDRSGKYAAHFTGDIAPHDIASALKRQLDRK